MTTMLIAGRRGGMAHAAETSLGSCAVAGQVGGDENERGVRLSADRERFLLHDATLDRTAGDDSARDRGPAGQLTLAQLQEVDLDSGRGVVTLAERYESTSTVNQLALKDPETAPYRARYLQAH